MSNEIQAFAPLPDGIDLTGAVITADALHTQHGHASHLHERGAHCLTAVKGNPPASMSEPAACPGVTSACAPGPITATKTAG